MGDEVGQSMLYMLLYTFDMVSVRRDGHAALYL